MNATKPDIRSARHGVVPSMIHFAIDVTDRCQSTAIATAQDIRTELRTFVDTAVDVAEKATLSMFRVTRKVVQRIDDTSGELLTSFERLMSGALNSTRETTRAASDLAQTAATEL